jgi:hypothetical protein
MADEHHSAVPGGVQVRDGTKARHKTLELTFAFADRNVIAAPCPGTLWISVGTSVGSGIINFRARGSAARGACERVVQLQGQIFDHVFGGRSMSHSGDSSTTSVQVKIVLPEDWKPDDAAAVWLVKRLLEDGALPPLARELAANMGLSRRNPAQVLLPRKSESSVALIDGTSFLKALQSEPLTTPIPLFTAMLCHFQCRGETKPPRTSDGAESDAMRERRTKALYDMLEIVDRAHGRVHQRFIEDRDDAARSKPTWRDFDMLRAPEWIRKEWSFSKDLAGDVRKTLDQLSHVDYPTPREIFLPAQDKIGRCRALLLRIETDTKPGGSVSTYFTAMALSGGLVPKDIGIGGKTPLVVLSSQRRDSDRWRHDVFLTPVPVRDYGRDEESPRALLSPSLRGLGLELERREQDEYEKRDPSDQRGTSPDPRRGSKSRYRDIPHIDDPWYDGRDHDYLIVGSPHVGSVLSPETVGEALASAFWLPKIARRSGSKEEGYFLEGRFEVTVRREPRTDSAVGIQNNSPNTQPCQDEKHPKRVFRRWEETEQGNGSYRIHYAMDSDSRGQPRQATCVCVTQSSLRKAGDQSAPPMRDADLRADPDVFADRCRDDHSFLIVLLRPDPPPLHASKSPNPTIVKSVPKNVRQEFATRVCHPRQRTIRFGPRCLADVGPGGIVLWDLDGKFLQSEHDPRSCPLPRAVLVCADVLAHESELKGLANQIEQMQGQNGPQDASGYLERFVDIASEYRPERVNAGLRRLCAAIDSSRAVPSLIERLERVLKFTDERERLAEDRSQRQREWLLNAALLLLALLALVGIPADLIQAANSWPETERIHGLSPWEFLTSDAAGRWILWSAPSLLAISAVLAVVVVVFVTVAMRTLGSLKRKSALVQRLSRGITSYWRNLSDLP